MEVNSLRSWPIVLDSQNVTLYDILLSFCHLKLAKILMRNGKIGLEKRQIWKHNRECWQTRHA